MTKKPFVTKEKLEEIAAAVPTPFHIYDMTADATALLTRS